MKRVSGILRGAMLLAAAALTSCAAPFNGPQDVTDERAIFPISVAPHMETLKVSFGGTAWGLSPEMDSRLAAFTKDYLQNGNGVISVSVPNDDEAARRYFAERLSQLGVPAWRILFGNGDTALPNATVEISYIRYAAETPACGDWSKNSANTASNLSPPNFGCATQHNIAAMVADPRDFIRVEQTDAADAKRRMTVLDKYRKGEPTPASTTAEQSGAVADVNKQ
jgi:pilus assembly protein CpaD